MLSLLSPLGCTKAVNEKDFDQSCSFKAVDFMMILYLFKNIFIMHMLILLFHVTLNTGKMS